MVDHATPDAVRHYLERAGHLVQVIADAPDPERCLAVQLAPDMFDTGFNLAVGIGFAARALCPPAGLDVPPLPEPVTLSVLHALHREVTAIIGPINAADLTRHVEHVAGEARLSHAPADYITRFALPNMIFHLTLAYAALRQHGLPLGKADFDGLHIYTPRSVRTDICT
ncbi:MAG: DUF1993 family protein [Pseudomonadota bacterium]